MKKTVLSLIQMKMDRNPKKNEDKAEALIRKAAGKGAHIICLPELFNTIYFAHKESKQYFKWAVTLPGKLTERFASVAKECNAVILLPTFEKRTRGLYHNSMSVIDADGKYLGHYRKMHIPDDPGFTEKYYFAPGDLGFKVFETAYAKIGTLICWDQWYPEAARITALMGAEILVYPTAIGWLATERPSAKAHQLNAWQTVQRSHAVTNGVYVAAVNRTGTEHGTKFWGSSFVAAPDGSIIKQASVAKEEILYTSCDFAGIEEIRQEWPFLRDRRIDAYKPITKRFAD